MLLKVKFFVFLILIVPSVYSQKLYVSPSGNDSNSGTVNKPFATLEKARETVRKLQNKKNGIGEGAIIYLRGGNYYIKSSLEFNNEDSGLPGKPVTYCAYRNEKVRLIAGKLINSKSWKPLSDDARKRVHPKVNANSLFELDVNEAGLKNVDQFAPSNQFTTSWFIIDLFANDKRQPISQWPNLNENIRGKNDPGWTTANGSKDNKSFYFGEGGKPQDNDSFNELDADGINRSERWQNSLKQGHQIWLKGLWRTAWEPITMKVKEINTADRSISMYEEPPQGMGSKYTAIVNQSPLWRVGSGKENWFALNLLDEIDQPGEWSLDFKDHKLYYYPLEPIAKVKIMICDTKMPIVKFNNVQHIQFKGISLEGGLGNGIELNNCNNVLIAGCNLFNIGNTAVSITGGHNNKIQSNNIHEVGGWGIEVKNAGDRRKLTSSKTALSNNYIHHVGLLAFKEAIILTNSVGVNVNHNLMHDIPKGAMRTDDVNNCIVEFNEVHNIALKEGDTGVFYNYGGWSTYGNIFRYNFSHHTNRANGFYCDDGDSGDLFYNNIVQGSMSAVKFGGGHDNIADNNLFIENKDQTVDDRGINRNYRLGTKYEANLKKFNIDIEPWKSYGQQLKAKNNLKTNLWTDVLESEWHPEFPNGSRVSNNVAVVSASFKKPKNGDVEFTCNISIATIKEAGFYNYATMDIRTDNKLILEKFPDLNKVYLEIGLQKDEYRKSIPTRAETGGLNNRTNAEGLDTEDKMVDKVN